MRAHRSDVHLSRFVHRDGDAIFCTTQKIRLPADSSEEVLRENLFLAGQEKEAIDRAIFDAEPSELILNINPTWRCNLRCTHCDVIHRLVKKETESLDAVKLVRFVDAHRNRYGTKTLRLRYAGGEPLLVPDKINEISDAMDAYCKSHGIDVQSYMTTNLAMDLTDSMYRVIDRFDSVTVSIDGLEEVHNEQRKDVVKNAVSPFQRTIANLKQLMIKGHRDKISVQGAVKDKYFHDIVPFYRMLLKIGISRGLIKYACIHPTLNKPEGEASFLDVFRKHELFAKPCCKYQHMANLTVDNKNKIYTDFYIFTPIGDLDEPIEVIESRAKQSIRDEMPALKDPKCIECPVIGYCWGDCSMGNFLWKDNPGRYCDQDLLISKVDKMVNFDVMKEKRHMTGTVADFVGSNSL